MAGLTYSSDFFASQNEFHPTVVFEQLEDALLQYLRQEKKMHDAQVSLIVSDIYQQWESECSVGKRKSLTKMKRRLFAIADRITEQVQKEMDKNFGLTEPEFEELLLALQQGDRSLYEQAFLTHFEPCMTYLQRTYGASHEDAYDATMDTMLVFCKRLKNGKVSYGNLRFLFTRIAGQVYMRAKKKQPDLVGTEEAAGLPEIVDAVDSEALAILNKAWGSLCGSCSALLKAFYYENITLNEYAEQQDKSPAAIRKQKQRCVEKLRILFTKHYSQ